MLISCNQILIMLKMLFFKEGTEVFKFLEIGTFRKIIHDQDRYTIFLTMTMIYWIQNRSWIQYLKFLFCLFDWIRKRNFNESIQSERLFLLFLFFFISLDITEYFILWPELEVEKNLLLVFFFCNVHKVTVPKVLEKL